MEPLNLGKLKELIILLARHECVHNLGVTKLAKLLYYIEVESLRSRGAGVTNSEFIKHEHGPVPSRMERAIKQLRQAESIHVPNTDYFVHTLKKLTATRGHNASMFDDAEMEIIDRMAKKYGRVSAKELSSMSHDEPAWENAEWLQKLDPMLMLYGTKEDPEDL